MKKTLPLVAALATAIGALGVAVPQQALAADVRAEPREVWKDAGVRKAYPSTNYGSATSALLTGSDASYYMAANTVLPDGALAQRAVLYVTPLQSTASRVQVRAVPGDPYAWSESQLTWREQPALSSTLLAQSAMSTVAGQRLAIPVPLSAVQSPDTDLRLSASGSSTRVATAEHPNKSWRPQLVIEYTVPHAVPAPTTTAPTSAAPTTPVVPAVEPVTSSHTITGIAHYTSPTGSDTTGDGSLTRPWRSWAKGLASLRALGGGHTLVLRGGVYTERFDSAAHTPRGTAAAPVRITSQPGETVVVQGLQRFYDPDYLTIDHLVFESAAGDDPTQHTVRIVNGVGWTVEDSEFRNLRSFSGLHVTSYQNAARPAQATVRRNVFRDQVDARPAVSNNTQHFVYAGVGANGGLTITRNEFLRGVNTGGAVKIGPDSSGAVEISYNTFAQNAPYTLLFENVVDKTRIFRNIFAATGASHLQLWNYRGIGTSLHDNLWSGQKLLTYGGTTTAAERDELLGTGNVNVDPRFTDLVTGDLRPLNPAAAGYGRHA